MTDDLKINLIDERQFKDLRMEWNRLLEKSNSISFFLKWEWLFAYWMSIKDDRTALLIYTIYKGNDLIGIAPLYSYTTLRLDIPLRKIKFLGDEVASDYLDFIIKAGYEQTCVSLFIDALLTANQSANTTITLSGWTEKSSFSRYALPLLSERHRHFLTIVNNNCPEIVLPQDIDEFTGNLSANTRYNLKRREKQLRRDFENVRFEFIDFDRANGLTDVLFDLHEKRWNDKKDKTSTFSNDFRKKFHNRLDGLVDNNDGFFSFVEVNGRIISIVLVFHYKGCFYFYQNGWEPIYSKYSIGLLNLYYVIQNCIKKQGSLFSLLRGEEKYKNKFANTLTLQYSIMIFRNTFPGMFMYWKKKSAVYGKKLLKTLLKMLRPKIIAKIDS